jgi:hypothetical protein
MNDEEARIFKSGYVHEEQATDLIVAQAKMHERISPSSELKVILID